MASPHAPEAAIQKEVCVSISASPSKSPRLSILMPVFNEEANLRDGDVWRRLKALAPQLAPLELEFIFIDDGSRDQTFALLEKLQQEELSQPITLLRFTRNFGAWAAIRAGLEHSRGDAAFIQTIDGEEPPELILQLVARWQEGWEVVWLEREARQDSLKSRLFARVYTYLMQRLVVPQYPDKGVAVPLLDRRVIDFLVRSRESSTPLIPLLYWAGFKQTSVPYVRTARRLGQSGWTFSKLVRIFADSFLAFTLFPIRLFSLFGAAAATVAFLWALGLLLYKLTQGGLVTGYTSMMLVMLFFAGIQMVFLGVMGEYLWRILEQVRGRPQFVLDPRRSADLSATPAAEKKE